jgi:hypothetical protein
VLLTEEVFADTRVDARQHGVLLLHAGRHSLSQECPEPKTLYQASTAWGAVGQVRHISDAVASRAGPLQQTARVAANRC